LKNLKALFTVYCLNLQQLNFGQLLYDSGPQCDVVVVDVHDDEDDNNNIVFNCQWAVAR
jgi:hypothetical protein